MSTPGIYDNYFNVPRTGKELGVWYLKQLDLHKRLDGHNFKRDLKWKYIKDLIKTEEHDTA